MIENNQIKVDRIELIDPMLEPVPALPYTEQEKQAIYGGPKRKWRASFDVALGYG